MLYFVEDDNNIRELVLYTFNSTGIEAVGFSHPSDFWKQLKKQLPQIILLDIMLPEEDGISILKKLRSSSATKKIPIIMLTAKNSEYDKVVGLDYGADDYVTKPFGMMELIARVKAALRRGEEVKEATEYRVGLLCVNPERHTVKVGDQNISLTLKEFEILCLLLEHRGNVFSRTKLLDIIWGYSFDGESRTVDVHIRTLRQKLGEAAHCIETVRGIGYRIMEEANDKKDI